MLLAAELPFADAGDRGQSLAVGNPYVGIEVARDDSPLGVEIGLRAPFSSTDDDPWSGLAGLYSDMDRVSAFAEPHWFALTAGVDAHVKNDAGYGARLRIAAEQLLSIDDADNELLLRWGAGIWKDAERTRAYSGVTGFILVTEKGDLADRLGYQLEFDFSFDLGAMRPGVHARIPLDSDTRRYVDVVLGISLSMSL